MTSKKWILVFVVAVLAMGSHLTDNMSLQSYRYLSVISVGSVVDKVLAIFTTDPT